MVRRIPAFMAATIVALFVAPLPCSACSCVKMTPDEMVRNAGLVFSGKVVEIRGNDLGDSHALIEVGTVWKGILPSSTVKVERGSGMGDCGIAFKEGSTYVVLATEREDDDVLMTSTCDGTTVLSSIEITSIAGEGTPIEEAQVAARAEVNETNPAGVSTWLWVAGGVIAGTVGVIVWRQRHQPAM